MIFSKRKGKSLGIFKVIKSNIQKQKKLVYEIETSSRYYEQSSSAEKNMIESHLKLLKQ